MVAADGDAGWEDVAIARVRLDSLGPGTPPDAGLPDGAP
jgi:hypothetical protein